MPDLNNLDISNYGNYASDNYGAHTMRLRLGRFTLWYSYNTVIAFTGPGMPLIGRSIWCCENCWGPTTGKHLNFIEPDKTKRVPVDEFEKELSRILSRIDSALNKLDN